MAKIVELRGMSNDKIEELLENAREEMFNLRFRNASAQLDDYSRLKVVRREIAQFETVLHMRQLAEESAAALPEIAAVLADKNWQANTTFSYEDSAWMVTFVDSDGNDLATANVNLNVKKTRGKKARLNTKQPNLVKSFEIAG